MLVEKAAIQTVRAFYEQAGYAVDDVQKDNMGWDLEARNENDELFIEVKGLSGEQLVVEVTPNEYKMLRRHRRKYRL